MGGRLPHPPQPVAVRSARESRRLVNDYPPAVLTFSCFITPYARNSLPRASRRQWRPGNCTSGAGRCETYAQRECQCVVRACNDVIPRCKVTNRLAAQSWLRLSD